MRTSRSTWIKWEAEGTIVEVDDTISSTRIDIDSAPETGEAERYQLSCPDVFGGDRCGYAGDLSAGCAHTWTACGVYANQERFGGFPISHAEREASRVGWRDGEVSLMGYPSNTFPVTPPPIYGYESWHEELVLRSQGRVPVRQLRDVWNTTVFRASLRFDGRIDSVLLIESFWLQNRTNTFYFFDVDKGWGFSLLPHRQENGMIISTSPSGMTQYALPAKLASSVVVRDDGVIVDPADYTIAAEGRLRGRDLLTFDVAPAPAAFFVWTCTATVPITASSSHSSPNSGLARSGRLSESSSSRTSRSGSMRRRATGPTGGNETQRDQFRRKGFSQHFNSLGMEYWSDPGDSKFYWFEDPDSPGVFVKVPCTS